MRDCFVHARGRHDLSDFLVEVGQGERGEKRFEASSIELETEKKILFGFAVTH
jgi:hypothetical protein